MKNYSFEYAIWCTTVVVLFIFLAIVDTSFPVLDMWQMPLIALPVLVPTLGPLGWMYLRPETKRWEFLPEIGKKACGAVMMVTLGMIFILCVVTYINGQFDRSAAVAHRSLVVDLVSRSKGKHLIVESWRQKGTTERIRINCRDYKRVVKNQTIVEVKTHPGFLGMEWIESFRLL